MADLGDGPQSSAAVAARLGRTPKSISPQRDALIGNAVIYAPSHGLIDFTVPHCGAFIRRRYPLAPARVSCAPRQDSPTQCAPRGASCAISAHGLARIAVTPARACGGTAVSVVRPDAREVAAQQGLVKRQSARPRLSMMAASRSASSAGAPRRGELGVDGLVARDALGDDEAELV